MDMYRSLYVYSRFDQSIELNTYIIKSIIVKYHNFKLDLL